MENYIDNRSIKRMLYSVGFVLTAMLCGARAAWAQAPPETDSYFVQDGAVVVEFVYPVDDAREVQRGPNVQFEIKTTDAQILVYDLTVGAEPVAEGEGRLLVLTRGNLDIGVIYHVLVQGSGTVSNVETGEEFRLRVQGNSTLNGADNEVEIDLTPVD
jgi:hypothetical protein